MQYYNNPDILENKIVTLKPIFISEIDNKLSYYLYCNNVNVDYLYIGAIIGKKGFNIKNLIDKVKDLTFDKKFEYYIDKNITPQKTICIYILANNKATLRIATEQLHSNIQQFV
jgi:transcription antitermination factor NusA-like protein